MTKKKIAHSPRAVSGAQALALHQGIAALIREFKLEPGMLAGSVYADLHANDIALFEILAAPGRWSVQAIAKELGAPVTTVSSALDRLERNGLIERKRTTTDRRVVLIELAAAGHSLASRLTEAHVKNCRVMLGRLSPAERDDFLRLVARMAQPHSDGTQSSQA